MNYVLYSYEYCYGFSQVGVAVVGVNVGVAVNEHAPPAAEPSSLGFGCCTELGCCTPPPGPAGRGRVWKARYFRRRRDLPVRLRYTCTVGSCSTLHLRCALRKYF